MGQKSKNRAALELTFPKAFEKLLSFPTMHILVERMPDQTLAAHCLDFDTWAHSEEKEFGIAVDQVVRALLEMALLHYTRLYQKKVLERLYDNEVDDPAVWREYRELMSPIRVANLKDTMDLLFENQADLRDSEISDSETEKYDLSDLEVKQKEQVREWLRELAHGSPEKKSEIILAMMDSLVKIRPSHLSLVS